MRARLLSAVLLGSASGLGAQTSLSPPVAPPENPVTAAKALLGKALFWDEQLSSNGRMACGTCHRPEHGGGDPRRRRHPGLDGTLLTADDTWGSPGVERRDTAGRFVVDPRFGRDEQVTQRAAPGVTMAAWFETLFWDGRIDDTFVDPETGAVVIANGAALEALALHPFTNPVEMARDGRSWAELRQRVATVRPLALASDLPPDLQLAVGVANDYPTMFAIAFGDGGVTLPRIAMALASYLRTTVPDQTPWDRHQQGVPGAMTSAQLAGLQHFVDVKCADCHTPGLFSDRQFRALGLTPVAQDPGRAGVTGDPADRGRFKVPSLRNAALKSTFLHNGRFTTMLQVVNFYRLGGGLESEADSLLQPFALDQVETAELLDFLENALVDPRARLGLPPFDRPTLWSEIAPVGSNLYGTHTPVAGTSPVLHAQQPPFLGHSEWALGFSSAPANGVGVLFLGLLPAAPGAQLAGATLHVDAWAFTLPFALDATGSQTFGLPVPYLPALSGLVLHGQAFVADVPTATQWGATRGATLPLR